MHPLPALCLLFKIMLTLRGFQVQTQKTDEEDHLCSRLVKRQLDRIHLKSITFSPTLQLIIYEGDRFYRISDSGGSGMHDDHIPLPEQSEGWNEKELKSASSLSAGDTSPDLAYFLTYTIIRYFVVKETRMVALLILETFEKIYSIAPDSTDEKAKGTYPAKVLFTRGRPAEEFALIVRQESKDETWGFITLSDVATLDGFVLHKDTWHNSRQYVLYDLPLDQESSELKVYLKRSGSDDNSKNPAPSNYYHIQRTTAADEVLLVQGGGNEEKEKEKEDPTLEKYSPTRSLFGGMDKYLPVGYRHGKYTFLFDQLLGCVYRLEHEHGLKLDSKSEPLIRLKRTNIPYERFFRCSSEHFPAPAWNEEERFRMEKRWPPNRCEQNVLKKKDNVSDVVVPDETTTPSAGEVAVGWKTIGAITGGGSLLLLVAFFAVFLYRRRWGKMSTANSVFSGSGRQQQQQSKLGGQKKTMLKKWAGTSSSAPSTWPFTNTTTSSNAASPNSSSEGNNNSKWRRSPRPKNQLKEGGKKGGGGDRKKNKERGNSKAEKTDQTSSSFT